jgi:predicted NBD/HSP70 family sugar kinase
MQMISTALASGESSLISGVEPIALEAIVKAAEAGDLLSLRVLDTAGRWLGIGIANLVNILNPQLLIINGEAIVLGAAYLEKSLRENVFDSIIDSMQIVYESGNNEIWARGAACVVLNSLFTQPVSRHTAQVFFRNKLLDNKEH